MGVNPQVRGWYSENRARSCKLIEKQPKARQVVREGRRRVRLCAKRRESYSVGQSVKYCVIVSCHIAVTSTTTWHACGMLPELQYRYSSHDPRPRDFLSSSV